MSCERQQQAVVDLQNEVNGLQSAMRDAPPAMKHSLAGQIWRLQNQLATAKLALKACQDALLVKSGKVKPSYQLLYVIYAPPGTNGGRGTSSVDHGAGSTLGSTRTTANSFRAGMSISASVKGSVGVNSATVSAGVDESVTSTDSSSIDVKKSKSTEIKVTGPASGGIDHDHDLYYLCLNPNLDVSIKDNHLTWGYDGSGGPMQIVCVYGGWLKNPGLMPTGLKARLTAADLAQGDFQQILAANPFSSGSAIDPNRFLPTASYFPYEPPYSASDPVPTMTYSQKNDVTQTSSSKRGREYGVNFSVEGDVSFATVFKATLKTAGTFTWTDSNSLGTNTLSTQSASVTVGGPAFGFQGPPNVAVYWDTIFNTFMFAYENDPVLSAGQVADAAGNPVVGKQVMLHVGSRVYRTMTNSKGNFRIFGTGAGAGLFSVDAKRFRTTLGQSAPLAHLVL